MGTSAIVSHFLYIASSKVESKNTVISTDKQLSVPLHQTTYKVILQTTVFTCIMSYTVVTQINAIQTIEVTTNPYLLQMIFINARNGIT